MSGKGKPFTKLFNLTRSALVKETKVKPSNSKPPTATLLSELVADLKPVKTSSSTPSNASFSGDSTHSKESYEKQPLLRFLDAMSDKDHCKEVSHGWKKNRVFKTEKGGQSGRLVRLYTQKLGTEEPLNVFDNLGQDRPVEDYNALIECCIQNARNSDEMNVALKEFDRACMVFNCMRERGFEIGEQTYGPILKFIIDRGMVEMFQIYDKILKENPKLHLRLAYYEMLFFIKVGDENKIQMLIANTKGNDDVNFNESYLIALCEGNRQEEVFMLIDTIDIMKVSSEENRERLFKSLGMLLLESYAKKFILELKTAQTTDSRGGHLSNLIYSYATNIPNIPIEDIVVKFKSLQAELRVPPSSGPLEKLIKTCCYSLKVHLAIDLAASMLDDGLSVKITTLNHILRACDASYDYYLVDHIYSMIKGHKIHASAETFRLMIHLCVKMKKFDEALAMIEDLERLNLFPNANMYNAIMGGYFRQKDFHKGLMVLKKMDASNVEPDSQTYSYIIGNCNTEDDIIKYHRELRESGVMPTKHIFMALINGYATCGLFEKAKKVLLDEEIPVNSLNEIKSSLVSVLAANGQMADALKYYDEIIEAKENLEPKAAICLIEHLQSEGELCRLLQLLVQLQDSELWDEGCSKIILYSVQHKLLCSAVHLLKQRMEKSKRSDEMAIESLLDEVFCKVLELQPADVQFGLDLLQKVKDDIGIQPSRRSLDFLLGACVKANDQERSLSVWKEYQSADLPYNIITYARMYQALLVSGAYEAAEILLKDIPDDDPNVRVLLEACRTTLGKSVSQEN